MWEWRTIARSPAPRSVTAHCEEVERPLQSLLAQAEVTGGDRRREAAVERPGEADPAVDGVPAKADRDLVGAQLAGVEEPEQLDSAEMPLAEVAELGGPVLAH